MKNIFERAVERGCSWKEQAFWEGMPIATINVAEKVLEQAGEQWALAAHNEGVGHEQVACWFEDMFWGILSGRIDPDEEK